VGAANLTRGSDVAHAAELVALASRIPRAITRRFIVPIAVLLWLRAK